MEPVFGRHRERLRRVYDLSFRLINQYLVRNEMIQESMGAIIDHSSIIIPTNS